MVGVNIYATMTYGEFKSLLEVVIYGLESVKFDTLESSRTIFLIFPLQMLDGRGITSRLWEVWWGAHLLPPTGFRQR